MRASSTLMGVSATHPKISALMAINPDRDVSIAASGVHSSYKDVPDQMKRDLIWALKEVHQ